MHIQRAIIIFASTLGIASIFTPWITMSMNLAGISESTQISLFKINFSFLLTFIVTFLFPAISSLFCGLNTKLQKWQSFSIIFCSIVALALNILMAKEYNNEYQSMISGMSEMYGMPGITIKANISYSFGYYGLTIASATSLVICLYTMLFRNNKLDNTVINF